MLFRSLPICLCHTLFGTLAVAGLGRLVPAISGPMLVVGSAYMIWIGMALARSAIVVGPIERATLRSSGTVFFQAVLTCLLNPKAWLFILAVYPQFMKADYGPLWAQALVMGAMTALVQFVIYGGLAWTATVGRNSLVSNPRLTTWLGRGSGIALVVI